MLAGRRVAVMAGEAGPEYLRVVNRVGRRERHVVVTVLANVARIDMGWILAGCLDAVMAVDTVCGNAAVVEIRGRPGNRCVAVVAIVAAQNMRWVLAGRCQSVVTCIAAAEHLCVINRIYR